MPRHLILLSLILTLLSAPLLAQDIPAKDKRIAELEQQVARIVELSRTSAEARQVLDRFLAAKSDLQLTAADFADGEASTSFPAALSAVAGKRGWATGGNRIAAATTSHLPQVNIRLCQYEFPPLREESAMQHAPLAIDVWISPGRITAEALYWLRSGGMLVNDSPREPNACYRTKQPKLLGEASYEFYPQLAYSILLPRSSPHAGGNRIGMLRGNLVIEASTTVYQRDPGGNWVCIGLDERTRGLLGDLLSDIDKVILSMSRRQQER